MATPSAGVDVRMIATTDATVLHLYGCIDASNHDALARTGRAALASGAKALVVDCDQLTYLDSALINAVIALRGESEGRPVTVQHLSPLGRRVFSVCEVPASG